MYKILCSFENDIFYSFNLQIHTKLKDFQQNPNCLIWELDQI